MDFRRARLNPYWRHHNALAIAYEGNFGPVGYHSNVRHGAHHTLDNIRARLIPNAAAGGGRSYMSDLAGGWVRTAGTSSRFATHAWHEYTREVAKRHFAVTVAPTGAVVAWTWPNALVAPVVMAANGFINDPNNAKFFVTYQNNIVGFSVDGAHQHGEACNATMTLVGYDNAGNAYINQHYPVVAAGAATLKIGAAAAAPWAAGNLVVPYSDVPWF